MGRTWIIAAPLALTLACASHQLDGGPESPVRLDTQPAVGWEPGGPFNLQLVVYNASGYRMMLVEPKKEYMQIKVYRLSDGKLACKTPAPTHLQAEGWEAKPVRGASGLKLSVDVWPYCRGLGEGVYRYEAVYLANPATGTSNVVWTGTIGPQGGRVAVAPGLSTDEAALAAVLAAAPQASAAAGAEPASSGPAEGKAGGETPAASPPVPPPNPDQVRACVDRELAARGLNAYGDPQGTRYDSGPPVDEGGRILYVASRSAEIRVACRIAGF